MKTQSSQNKKKQKAGDSLICSTEGKLYLLLNYEQS